MIYNGQSLYTLQPIADMLSEKVKHNGVSHGLGEAGYDIRIDQDIRFTPPVPYREGQILRDGKLMQTGNRFVLASSMEKFQMPNFLVGEVKDKSTWARQGVSLFNTVIEPGWHGYLTLEIVFHSNQEVHIKKGSGIAQVIFYGATDLRPYKGKYQNAEAFPQEAIQDL